MMLNEYNSVSTASSNSSFSMDEEDGKTSFSPNFNRPAILPIGHSLKALHLPPSIENIDNLPTGLWNWIHTQDFIRQESVSELSAFQGSGTKVIFNNEKLVNGKLVQSKHVITDNNENASLFEIVGKNVKSKDLFKYASPKPLGPKRRSYLQSSLSFRGSEFSMPRSMTHLSSKSSSFLLSSLSSVATKVEEPFSTSSVYIQAVELQGKLSSKVSSIFCEVEVGKRKYRTDPIKVEKHSTSIAIREGFLFDVPSANFTAVVRVYGIHQISGKSIFSSLFGRNRLSKLKGSTIRSSNDTLTNSMEYNQTSRETSNTCEGTEIYLGEVSFQLTNIKFSKLTGTYPLLISTCSSSSINLNGSSKLLKHYIKNNKNNISNKSIKSIKGNSNKIPKIVVQIGIYNEEQSKIEPPKIPSDIKNISLQYENYISFLIHSNQNMIWRRYWAQILNNYLYIYDSEYRNKKSAITRLNLGYIKDIEKTDPESIYVNNGITIKLENNYLSSETGEELIQNVKTIPLQFEYINGDEILTEDLVKNKESWSNWNLSSLNDGYKIYSYTDSKCDRDEWIEFINKAKSINQ